MFLREVFFSRLHYRKVEDVMGRRIGLLQDVVVSLHGTYPTVVGLRVGEGGYIPMEAVMGGLASRVFRVLPDVRKESLSNEYDVAKLLLDKQVLDYSGKRVYRVNDMVFVSYGREDEEERCCFAGVDVGIGGIYRRVGLSWLADMVKERLIGWYNIAISDEGDVPFCLRLNRERLRHVTADDIGAICRQFDRSQRRSFLGKLPHATVCRALFKMSPDERKVVLTSFEEEELFLLLRSMPEEWQEDVRAELPLFYRYRHRAKGGDVP